MRSSGLSTRRLSEILDGHPRLLAYDLHALGEGTDTTGAVTVRIAPPDAAGKRGTGEYAGEARGTNIIAASIEAYIVALNAMLGEAHWEGAPEAASATGKRARAKAPVTAGAARERRAELDEESGRDRHDRLVQPPGLICRGGAGQPAGAPCAAR